MKYVFVMAVFPLFTGVATSVYNSLSLGNVVLFLPLLLLLHYIKVLYEFRGMPPGPRSSCLPVLGNVFSLKTNVEKMAGAFER